MQKLHVRGLGLAFGITWGAGIFLLGLCALLWNWGTPIVISLNSVYLGYAPTFLGSILGGIWGFCDGFIGGIVIAWLYNKFVK